MCHSFRGLSLRPVTDEDLPFLFGLLTDPDRCHLWMRCRQVFDERTFYQAWAGWTVDMIGIKFLVVSGDRPIGLAFEYDRAMEDGHTKATALLRAESTGHGAGVIATALLMDRLFRALPFRKVYLEVYGYNPRVLGMLRKLGLAEEGVLKADRFHDGSWWDLHVFAAYRHDWQNLCPRFLRPGRRARGPGARPADDDGKEVTAIDAPLQANGCSV